MPQDTRDEEVSMLTLACVRELLAKRVRLVCLSQEQHRPSWPNLHHFAADLGMHLQHALHGNQGILCCHTIRSTNGHAATSHWAERSECSNVI